MSFRLKTCLTTATATSGCRPLHVRFPLLHARVLPLMFPDSSHSRRNSVWGEIKCLGFCGDHPTPVIHSLIYLTLNIWNVWILLPPWCNDSHLHCATPTRLHVQLLLSFLKTTALSLLRPYLQHFNCSPASLCRVPHLFFFPSVSSFSSSSKVFSYLF